MKNKIAEFFKKYWVVIAIILIVILGTTIRLLDYRWPYLRNIDSYNFARQIEEVATYGHMLPYDELGQAPGVMSRGIGIDFYIYLAGYAYLFFKLFIPTLSLYRDFLIWFPALLPSLSAIPMYFIGKTLFDRRAGVLAAFFIVFDIAIFQRSLGGDPDSDSINIIMSLVAMAAFLIAYKYSDKINKIDKKYIIYTLASGLAMAAWVFSWGGFWYVIWMITGFLIVTILVNVIKTKNTLSTIREFRYKLLLFGITMFIAFAIAIPLLGVAIVQQTIYGPTSFGDIKSEGNTPFPNVYVSVAELQTSGTVKDIIQRSSAINFDQNPIAMLISPFFLMIYGLIYLLYSYIKKRQHLDTLVLLGIWFIGPFMATVVAVRFSILFSAPIALGSAILLAKIIRMIESGEKFGD